MQLSRFVIIHEGVREDENVLCSVLSNRYVGVDDAVLEADVARELSAQGFLVEDRAVDDRGLREHLEKGAMRRFGEGIIKVENVVEAAALIRLDRLVRRKRRDAVRSETLDTLGGPCKLHWDNQASFEEAVPRRYLEELGAAPWDDEGRAAEAPPRQE
jgi:hypothetical protein